MKLLFLLILACVSRYATPAEHRSQNLTNKTTGGRFLGCPFDYFDSSDSDEDRRRRKRHRKSRGDCPKPDCPKPDCPKPNCPKADCYNPGSGGVDLSEILEKMDHMMEKQTRLEVRLSSLSRTCDALKSATTEIYKSTTIIEDLIDEKCTTIYKQIDSVCGPPLARIQDCSSYSITC